MAKLHETEKELLDATEESEQKKKEERQDYLGRIARSAARLKDDDWQSLSPEAQDWANDAIQNVNDKKDILDFGEQPEDAEPGDVEEEEESGTKEKGKMARSSKARRDEEEPEDTEEQEADSTDNDVEEEEDDTPTRGRSSKAKRGKSKKDDGADKKDKSSKKDKSEKSEKKAGRPSSIDGSSKIKVLKENARRPGTDAAKKYALYKDGITVDEVLKKGEKLGMTIGNIKADVARGNIKLV